MNALFSLFSRARANKNLSPIERAILRLSEGLGMTALVAALPVVADALSSSGTIIWGDVLHTALAAATVAVLLALLKYGKSLKDNPLVQAAEPLLENAAHNVAQSAKLPATNTSAKAN